MFIYEFKSRTCLITKIAISGSYLTIYTNKKNSQELRSMRKALGLDSDISGDDPEHIFCHNPYVEFSARGDTVPHKHLQFPSHVNKLSHLRKIFKFLIDRQNQSNLRKQDYENFIQALDEERKSNEDKEFPDYVQEVINHYDIEVPYLPENEIEVVLSLFQSYQNTPYLSHLEELCEHAEKLLKNNYKIIHGRTLTYNTNLSEADKTLCDYYNSLLKFRKVLLAINYKTDDLRLYFKANTIIKEITTNPTYANELSFQDNITYFNILIDSQIKSLNFSALLKGGALGSILSMSFFFLTEESFVKAFFLGLTTSSIAILGTKIVTDGIKNTFFGQRKNTNNNNESVAAIIVSMPPRQISFQEIPSCNRQNVIQLTDHDMIENQGQARGNDNKHHSQ